MKLRVFIENEAGSNDKNVFDERTLAHLGTVEVSCAYPFPYGFVIGTKSGDGDAVDCFVLTDAPLRSGTTVACEPVGLLEQIEDGDVDHKVLALPLGASATIDDALKATLTAFVTSVFAHVPGKRMEVGRLLGREEAQAYVQACSQSGGD
jgi:inorganic pyrophosphatase